MPLRKIVKILESGKPYDVCVSCPRLGSSCDGPNFLAMSFDRWIEWCELRASYLGISHSTIAERAETPKSTVDSVLSGKLKDVKRETMARITHAITGTCWGKYPCHDPVGAQLTQDDLAEECKRITEEFTQKGVEARKKIDHLKKQVESMDAQIADHRVSLRRKDRVVFILAVMLTLCVVSIIGVLLYGYFSPHVIFI